jgi:hypothetical protein
MKTGLVKRPIPGASQILPSKPITLKFDNYSKNDSLLFTDADAMQIELVEKYLQPLVKEGKSPHQQIWGINCHLLRKLKAIIQDTQ